MALRAMAGLVGLLMLGGGLGASGQGSVSRLAEPFSATLGLSLNRTVVSAGDTLTVGATVTNAGGGPVADFYFAIVLPDGSTVVSAGPGIGARFGRFNDLRTLVPVATGIGLGAPFTYQNDTFFAYTFNGSEPRGTYRVYFASLRRGALGDGVIGAGELLALTTAEFRVEARIVTVVDPTRTASALVQPAGGEVETSSVNGVEYTLSVPQGALSRPTTISVTPIVSAANLPGSGGFVLGVRAEPSSLQFDPGLTLTARLPTGQPVSPDGYVAFVTDNDGGNIQVVPVREENGTLTVTVPHFSNVVVAQSVFFFCRQPVSAQMSEACQVLTAAYQLAGGFTPEFKAFALVVLQEWFTEGLQARIDAVSADPGPSDADARLDTLYEEFLAWGAVYRVAAGPLNIYDSTRPLAPAVDYALTGLSTANILAQDRANARCLADKPNVARYVGRVAELGTYWETAFDTELRIYEREYRIGLDIDAAPPPVLNPGQASAVPLSIRAMFTDGVERPGTEVLLSMTASNATVTPGGGERTLPVYDPVSLLPAGSTSFLSIVGTFTEPGLRLLPVQQRGFPAGDVTPGFQLTALRVTDPQGQDTYEDEGGSVASGWIERERYGPATNAPTFDYRSRSRRFIGPGGSSFSVETVQTTTQHMQASATIGGESRIRFLVVVPTEYSITSGVFGLVGTGSNMTGSATMRMTGETGDGPAMFLNRTIQVTPGNPQVSSDAYGTVVLQPGLYEMEVTGQASATAATAAVGGVSGTISVTRVREVP